MGIGQILRNGTETENGNFGIFARILRGPGRPLDPNATPVGQDPVRTQAPYVQPTQTSQYANPIPQFMPSRFDMTPYAQAYQQQFNQMLPQVGQALPPGQSTTPAQIPQSQAPISGLGALAQLYGMYNAAPQTAEAQGAHAASLAAAANTSI